MNKKKKKILILSSCLLFLIPVILIGFVFYEVTLDASTRIQRGAIDRIIASESPVYYDDGETPIGVFFEKTHRKYIHFSEIPKVFIKALIAAEDGNFFSHRGVDLKATLRALIANIKSGKVVQGGSTISQQTAKNIFRREKRSYGAKLRELVQAFLLERKYTKEEILEMYINQFFVTGYGKGLGIAAQCFFDKEAKNLDLVEAAFIAGSVKGPNRYNPFIKKSEPERNHARKLAKQRKDYVLKNMFNVNFITRDQYLKAKELSVPFKEGNITYRLNVILDYIREQLESDYFRSVLEEQGVTNAAASGISIYTSINREIQEAALTSLRTHLPLMDVKLNGYSARQMPDTYRDLFKKSSKKQSSLPFMARITHIDTDTDHCRLVVSWGQSGGIINFEGIKPMAQAWLKWKLGNSAVLDKKYVRMFFKNFRVGDTVPVQMIPPAGGTGETRLMLSKIPELEGGVVVLQKGMVKAMVGGFLDRFFNRAVDAKRQLGSIFKPIVYTAALQLKWNTLDPLRNTRDMFQFENTFYLPHPDHKPKSETVSMVWAGAKSENLATVWLLYHLTDHLNISEFRKVMQLVDLDRNKGESYLEYKKRIRDHHGVVVNTEAMKEAAFKKSVKEIASDIIFGGHEEILNNLNRLHFHLDSRRFNPENPEERCILRFSFQTLHALNMNM
ncbi:MAG: transglycosylase domain-containing protein, partial [Deltaproteobacteria bacterium]|nr:transglycosylase domain-containing protein [Deltaproteobacteria bacterium]